MAGKPMWMVRAGEGGAVIDHFRSGGFVAIGWQEVGDMTPLKTREQFTKAVQRGYPARERCRWPSRRDRRFASFAR